VWGVPRIPGKQVVRRSGAAREHHERNSMVIFGRCAQATVYDPDCGKSFKNAFDCTKKRLIARGVSLF
jgi:hypothetical protein